MIHIVTSNAVPMTSVRSYGGNFQLCHHFNRDFVAPFNKVVFRNVFNVYLQDGMAPDEDYKSTESNEFDFRYKPNVLGALENIVDDIVAAYDKDIEDAVRENREPEEVMILVACVYSGNAQVVASMNRLFKEHGSDLKALNIYQYLKIADPKKLGEVVKNILGSDFVYPDEPISFSYALDRAIVGLM